MSNGNEFATKSPNRIYVTGDCDGLPDLREALAAHPEVELVGSATQVAEAAATLTGGHLNVVLHATRAATLPVNELAAIREHTRAPLILLASNGSPALLEEALEHDVADVLLLPQLTDNVVFSIRKAGHVGKRLTGDQRRHGRLVTVFSPKGGTGKTVTATNLGTSLAKHWGKRALLLDLDLQFGDAAIMLGIEPEKTIYDLVTAPGELDSEKLAGYTTKHASGLEILPAPLRPEDAELVTEAKLARLLEVARESFDVIVVDTSPFFHGPMLATLDRTDELLLLCGLDVPTLKNVRLSLQTLELLSFPPDRIKLVLNRANSKVGMKPKEVESALEREDRLRDPERPDRPARGQPRQPGGARRAEGRVLEGRPRDGQGARRRPGSGEAEEEVHGDPGKGVARWASTTGSIARTAPRTATGRSSTCSSAGRPRRPSAAPADPYAELKGRIHHACIAKLGPQLYAAGNADESSSDDLAEKVLRVVTEQLALDRTPLTREERRQVTREITDDILGYGPLEPLLRDDSVTEVMVNNHDRVYVERNGKIELDRRGLRRQRAPAAHHRQDRLAGRPARRRGLADGGRPPARRQPRERDHPAALAARADADDPEVLARPVHDGRPDQLRLGLAGGGAVPLRVRARASSTSSSPAVPAPVRRRR